jgi:diketogulonate reductase-like aldo/keto reductase
MRATEKLVAEGLVRFIGVSNFDVEELKEAERALKNERMACNQYFIIWKDVESSDASSRIATRGELL